MELDFRSTTGLMLRLRVWKPEGEVRAIVQILHGMAEYIDCYDEMAARLNQAGTLVVGHNHLGHGAEAEQLGYFGKGGFDALVEDAHTLRLLTQKEYPGVPYFLFGHSMGSFVARNYCLVQEKGLRGFILSGTGHFPPPLVTAGLVLAKLLCALGGERKPSRFLENMSFAGYNKGWSPAR
ncbi:MAG: alpha/beta fold hydrolase, partial [Firmicutes bacterium]|nr:alpha/beta fold hydrolase [Bacillota bacterium]